MTLGERGVALGFLRRFSAAALLMIVVLCEY